MIRPCFLVIDHEYSGSISTRKLVIETAKFNVLSAYSADEAIEIVRRFPAIDGAVVDSDIPGMPCTELIKALKAIVPTLRVISVSPPAPGDCAGADYELGSFDPKELLELLYKLVPRAAVAVELRNEVLRVEETGGAEPL